MAGAQSDRGAMNIRPVILAMSAALVASCASTPRIDAALSAPLSASTTAYRLLEPETPNEADRVVVQAVRQALAERGWRETSDKDGWRVEAAYAVRPQKTGVFTDGDARDGAWTEAPRLPQWWSQGRSIHSLTVILTGPGNAPGAHRASAVAVMGRRQAASAPQTLAQAAAAQLPSGASPAGG